MKRIFGVALLALPLAAGALHAEGWPFNVQAGGSFYIRGCTGPAPQAGPWYLYWPLEGHFVAPAPTGYPYWPSPQGLAATTIGGPACPPGVPVVPAPVAPAPAPAAVVPPPVSTMPPAANPASQPVPQAVPTSTPQMRLPPYLQPTSYYPAGSLGQAPSYWYER